MSKELQKKQDTFLMIHPKAKATKTSLDLSDDITEEEWETVGKNLVKVEGAIKWWVGDWANYKDRNKGKIKEKAEEIGMDVKSAWDAAWVSREIDTSRRREVLSWSHHREVASLDLEKQEHFLDLSEKEKLNRNELRKEIRDWKTGIEIETEMMQGKYRVIYADPPWFYAQQIQKYGPAERHYPTMKLPKIIQTLEDKNFTDILGENAVWFMWTTSPKMLEAVELANHFGFRYSGAQFIWDKIKHNYGHYNSVRHEHLLIFVKGSCQPDKAKLFDSVQSIERTDEHSEKPERFRQIIDEIYPRGNRIELFARREIEGWETWGNQDL